MPGPAYLRGDTVDLHVVEEEDLGFLQELINHPEVWHSLFQATPKTMADERSFYEEAVCGDDGGTHLLVCAEEGPVGTVGLSNVEPNWGIAELGYYVDPDAGGRGYATEAAELLVEYAFQHRRLEKLYANVLATNGASQRVLEKVGFLEEGYLREHGFVGGERVDVLRYGLLAGECGTPPEG